MASRLLCHRRVYLFGKNLQSYAKALCQSFNPTRKFSSQGGGDKSQPHKVVLLDEGVESVTIWPDPNLGLLGPQDHRLPLPGNVGFSHKLKPVPVFPKLKLPERDLDLFHKATNYERQASVLQQHSSVAAEDDIGIVTNEDIEQLLSDMPNPSDVLECVAQECPQLVRKDFQDLFPGRDITNSSLTVVTLAQKTSNDMTGWNEAVEIEREELTACFVDAAKELCTQLNDAGYWADFIDPSSGRPFLGPFTNATMFETDERYRYLGFSIEDLGCCKVISHRSWGTHSFVGCIFTNAPVDSDTLNSILRRHKDGKNDK